MILDPIQDIEKSENKKNHVDFLDGYRGTLALWVFIHHCNFYARLGCDYSYFHYTGYYIGVIGFFILSSYLLTYRLLAEFNKNNTFKGTILIFVKYSIRRFFRIYVPFVITCSIIKFGSPSIGGPFNWNASSWYTLITLGPAAGSQLWTIAPEVKYYFFIPFYAYFTSLMNKNMFLKCTWFLANTFFLFVVEYYRLFNQFNSKGLFIRREYEFLTRFTTFYLGSFLAFIVLNVQETEVYKTYEDKTRFRVIMGTLSMLMFLYGSFLFSLTLTPTLKEGVHFFPSSVYWACFLLLFVLSKENFFTGYFNGRFLYYCGKFSFGIYLYHMGFISFFYKNYNKKVKLKFEIVLYSFIGTFIAGCLFYYLIEKPLMNLGNKICNFISHMKIFN